ncbi:MAG: hypothetical protein WA432_00765 [Candidatus Babeliaceae bacterium]
MVLKQIKQIILFLVLLHSFALAVGKNLKELFQEYKAPLEHKTQQTLKEIAYISGSAIITSGISFILAETVWSTRAGGSRDYFSWLTGIIIAFKISSVLDNIPLIVPERKLEARLIGLFCSPLVKEIGTALRGSFSSGEE